MKVTVQQIADCPSGQPLPLVCDFRRWANVIETTLGQTQDNEVCVRIVDSAESHKLNDRYRLQAKPTNVLAFPCQLEIPHEPLYLGDIVLDMDTIFKEAKRDGKAGLSHWAHLFVHGVLHLYGYRHVSETEAKCMQAQESRILKRLGFADPYADERR